MNFVVRSFRATFVEGRFTLPVSVLGVLAMRIALFYGVGMPQIVPHIDNYLWAPIARFFTQPLVSLAASTLSVFLIASVLSLLNSRYNLLRSRSNLPFVVPLFLLSLHPYFLVMSGDYISILFVLQAFFPLLDSYQKPDSHLSSFRGAVLIGMASLFQICALVLLPLWWYGERSMRGFRFHSFVSSLFGLFLVYVSLFSAYCFLDDIPGFIQPFFGFASFSLPELPLSSVREWGGVVFIGLFFISGIIFASRIYSRDKVLILKLMRFIVFLMVILLFLQVIYWKESFFFLLLSIILISFLNAYLYSKTVSKIHIYMAYTILSLILLVYLSQLLPSIDPIP